jgi:hypothetical protein
MNRSIVGVTSTRAATPTYVSGDTNGNSELDADEQWLYTTGHTPTPSDPTPLNHSFSVTGKRQDGGDVSASAQFNTPVTGYDPRLFIDKDGPSVANVGDTVVFTYTVINLSPASAVAFNLVVAQSGLGDGSPVVNLNVTDDYAGVPIYSSGDFNSNGQLDGNEGWVFTASYTILPSDPNPLDSTATVEGRDPENDLISANDTHRLTIEAGDSNQIFLPLILNNR